MNYIQVNWYKYLHGILVLKCKYSVSKFSVGRNLLYNWTIFEQYIVISPFGIGKAIPRSCVYIIRWFIMCVTRRKKSKQTYFDVQKTAWYIQYRIDLPQRMSRFLLEVNGKFQFNSLIHC